MNRLFLSVALGMALWHGPLMAGPRDAQWKQVEASMQKGLPRSAITNLEPIIQATLKEKAWPEAVKAIATKVALEGQIQGDKPEERITRLEAERSKAAREMAPIFDTVLAHWYWNYFQQNRWRFMQRTTTASAPGKDFTTWDLPRLFAEIDRQFQKALAAETLLKSMAITNWSALLVKGTMPDEYRPTLYDFIAYEALAFYTSGEQAAANPQDAFSISASSPIFDTPATFLSWKPATNDQSSSLIRAIGVYQNLLRFHEHDPLPRAAFAAADLERLTWGYNVAFGEEKLAKYQASLSRFTKDNADYEISALAIEREARLLQSDGDWVGARRLALRGSEMFPNSPGGRLCRNLVGQIESRSSQMNTERVWNAPWPNITLQYRNLTNVYLRAIAYDWNKLWNGERRHPSQMTVAERLEILRTKPALEWSENLPPTEDFKEHTKALRAPDKLPAGFYLLFSSHDPEFSQIDNFISVCEVWVSKLALVTRQREDKLEGYVLDALSGEPVIGAGMTLWSFDNNNHRTTAPAQATDTNGFFSFTVHTQQRHLLMAQNENDRLVLPGEIWAWWQKQETPPSAQTVFFTDRSIYRPGQTVHYKGICLNVDQAKDNYQVLKGETVTVVFQDPNGKEIARQKHRANEYGSFAGSFTAPRDRLMGSMSLVVSESRANGSTSFRVEEYKRPKFEVTLDAPKTPAKLQDTVRLTGMAMGYTGAAVDGAAVSYRVVRQVRMPWWWGGWRGGAFRGGSEEIAHGALTTKADGSFVIEFLAKPDLKVPEKDDPSFAFEITADVTDGAGETRSADRSIRVGYTALEATLSAAPWLEAGKTLTLTVATRTLDAEPQVAEGSLKIYALEPPAAVHRASITGEDQDQDGELDRDLSQPNNWPLGKVVAEKGFTTDTNGNAEVNFVLPEGAYRAVVESQDRYGKKVTGRLPLQVINSEASRLGIKIPHLLTAPTWEAQPGETFLALWGTGYEQGRACVEILHRGQVIQKYWTEPGRTQQRISLPVSDAMRGGFTVHVTQVRENRSYTETRMVDVPWRNQELKLTWEHFVSKLQPGQKETWSLRIQGPAGAGAAEKRAAELVATLYDASLDAFAGHYWPQQFAVFRHDNSAIQAQFANLAVPFNRVAGSWRSVSEAVPITYRAFPPELVNRWGGYGGGALYNRRFGLARAEVMPAAPATSLGLSAAADSLAMPMAKEITAGRAGAMQMDSKLNDGGNLEVAKAKSTGGAADLSAVSARKNLSETAFFYPQLTTDSNGVARIQFTMPEALTKWRFLGFGHDAMLRAGGITGEAVTAKDLMVQPNAPRFLREGDAVEFTVKISNQSDRPQSGQARLTFKQLINDSPADQLLGNVRLEQTFRISPRESKTLAWRISVPDGCGFLSYKAVAATDKLSDGEEGAVPVLSRRVLVTESLPLPLRGPATKNFEFTRLTKSGASKTLQHQSLTVQVVSQPAWYAVLALPYLMEFPHECSEQTFNRFYANSLARSIANSDPKIHRVFEQWRNTPALESPLEKDQDLKSVALEETPWLRQAQAESQARRNVGVLFDDNRLNTETASILEKLQQMQLQDGSWPWFPGGLGNDYITLYITTGFGRLRHLGVDVEVAPAIRSLQRLDGWMAQAYERIMSHPDPEQYVPTATDALYLYGRSFFLKDMPIAPGTRKAVDFFLARARQHWLKTGARQTQGYLAIALRRFAESTRANDPIPAAILDSLRERSVTNEEMGMFWRDTELSWWWYRAPIETQALMIEAFDEIAHDAKAVEELRVWLLKQKQTQDWKTTKATADAVYALLLRGRELLSSDALVQVRLGGLDLTPQMAPANPNKSASAKPPPGARSQVEPGTGFYEIRFSGSEIKPKLGDIVLKKTDVGVAWGSVHWQYLEDMGKVTPYAGTPLKLRKSLYVKKNTERGPVLTPSSGAAQVGDELVVRIELRSDRDMEYLHLKDQRGSGCEPVNVLSHYKYQDGLAYYESTRDTASHFFIDYLPKGVYVFEYSTRVQLRGDYQTGVAEIQCMYAPEFNSHSESIPLRVK